MVTLHCSHTLPTFLTPTMLHSVLPTQHILSNNTYFGTSSIDGLGGVSYKVGGVIEAVGGVIDKYGGDSNMDGDVEELVNRALEVMGVILRIVGVLFAKVGWVTICSTHVGTCVGGDTVMC